ncbi:Peptidase family M23 [Salinihabitans flavidus]|uniref:Peptidase family M23 n=1 Tax=Salinihabitans flavidus TaxID=569882 RepID=A0A1H8SGT3_9RHOB|nr:M23 family metallopeptidase [Salinihabitans flavidus]SEO78239.1 Peptidase family M23 [Salinihabitans flavidus]
MRAALALLCLLSVAAPAAADTPVLALPIDCDPGADCHIQNLVDHDAGPGYADYTCGPLSYDGHNGTDFALPSLRAMEAGVRVLAAAPGTVTALRDGMADTGYSPETAPQIEGRDCGNGVVIAHEDGWETQYCHMKRESLTVRRGAQVEAGDTLGEVGLSGRTEFPHLHLSLRRDGEVVDPFTAATPTQCGTTTDSSLWQEPIEYVPGGLIRAGFATAVPEYEDVKSGAAGTEKIRADAPALVLFGFGFGSRAGDEMTLVIDGPRERIFDHGLTLDKTQAQYFRAAGTRLHQTLPSGTYTGTVTLKREGTVLDRAEAKFTLP